MPKYQDKFVAQADADPQAYAAFVRQKYGHAPDTVERMLLARQRLDRGEKLTGADTKMLQQAFSNTDPHWIASTVDRLNAQPPGLRSRYYTAMLAGDAAALGDDMVQAGEAYRGIERLAYAFDVESTAEAINAKRDAATAKDDKYNGRPAELKRYVPEKLSTRELISRQLEHPGARATADAIERGDETVVQATREAFAGRMAINAEVLADDGKDASIRDAIAAAYDDAAIEAVAVDEGWLNSED